MQVRHKIETIRGSSSDLLVDLVEGVSGTYVSILARHHNYRLNDISVTLDRSGFAGLKQVIAQVDAVIAQLQANRRIFSGPELKRLHIPMFGVPTRNVTEIECGWVVNLHFALVYRPFSDGYIRLFALGPDRRYRGAVIYLDEWRYKKLKRAVDKIERMTG